jgi:hypothetical protein
VQGIVDAQGRLRAPRVSGSDDLELCAAVRRASSLFRFSPALRNSVPVSARIAIPLVFPEQRASEFATGRLDLPPVALHELRAGPRPELFFAKNSNFTELFRLEFSDFEEMRYVVNFNDDARDFTGDVMPLLSFVVGPDGQPRDAKVLWARDGMDRDAALKRLAGYRYLPGIAQGRAVAVPLTLRIPAR